MASRLMFSGLSLLVLIGAGCHSSQKAAALPECKVPPTQVETIKVQVPPQKIVIEQPTESTTLPPVQITPKPESAPAPPPRPESSTRTPRLEASGIEAEAGALGALGQVAGFSRTAALTRSLGTVNSGGFSLGLGIQWIHIPIPLPRLFSVEETPSITVPLNEANLIQAGGVRGGESFTREDVAAAVAQELAMARIKAKQQEAAAAAPPPNDAERKALEKKLADAEAQIEKMNSMLKSIEEKLPPRKP